MRILVGTDGSAGAGTALALTAGLAWPAGTAFRIILGLDVARIAGPWTPGGMSAAAEMEHALRAQLEMVVAEEARHLGGPGRSVEGAVIAGRPSVVLRAEAIAFGADLVIVGSRGHGAIRTALLGSVAAELIDACPVPVLVSRRDHLRRILLATDGSDPSRGAEEALGRIHPLDHLPVEILSVVDSGETAARELLPVGAATAWAAREAAEEEARLHHEQIARDAAERLSGEGRTVGWTVRAGDPARTIIEEAEARNADLIAIGSHGRTGLDRLVLGSVARSVLSHARSSVLVAPGRRPA